MISGKRVGRVTGRPPGSGRTGTAPMKQQAGSAASSAPSSADGRREQMLRAALEVIAERGYPETRITDVAAQAGISAALVIYYFKTRDQLLTEAIRFSEDAWYATGTARMAGISTAAGRLEEIVAMTCLPDPDPDVAGSWLLWVGPWGPAPRN